MKWKFNIAVMAIMLLLGTVAFAQQKADPAKNVILILSGVTLAANGTSTYIIDTNSGIFGNRPTGEFGLQFSGVSPVGPVTAGATINAAWRGSQKMPSGVSVYEGLLPPNASVTTILPSTAIVSNMNVVTGNTEYVYGFFTIDATRYILVDITAGIASLWNVQAYVKVD